jgi:hypothetical protein
MSIETKKILEGWKEMKLCEGKARNEGDMSSAFGFECKADGLKWALKILGVEDPIKGLIDLYD